MMISLAGLSFLALPGCAGIGVSMINQSAGSAAGAGVDHAFGGTTYRTYSLPAPAVERAALDALEAMGMAVESVSEDDQKRVIAAKAHHRRIKVVLEPLTDRTTQMGVRVAEGIGFLHDGATATEIVLQTETRIGETMKADRLP